jgi:hypothetical protein
MIRADYQNDIGNKQNNNKRYNWKNPEFDPSYQHVPENDNLTFKDENNKFNNGFRGK